MTDKTLGQIADDAYDMSFRHCADRQRAWQAAAEAVAKAAGEETFEYALDLARSPRGDAERAIIKAAMEAKAAIAWACHTGDMSYEQAAGFVSELGTLHGAVEAYEKEKG